MSKFKSHFKFNKQERSGIFFLLLLIFCFQLTQFFLKQHYFAPDKAELIADREIQQELIQLREQAIEQKAAKRYRINPNYIDDQLGYTLGLSVAEIDRILRYRAGGSYFNSVEDFQRISGVSDAKLKTIVPRFKFPSRQKFPSLTKTSASTAIENNIEVGALKDLNRATAEELRAVNGIGAVLSERIIKFRKALGGFVLFEQLYDVYGLQPDVISRIRLRFELLSRPAITPLDLNKAGVEELAQLVYINFDLAKEIVAYRTAIGRFNSYEQLSEISGFPSDKIERIRLYLSL